MIDHKDFMHGAALVAIADSDGFTALNRASVKYGHYVVNHDRHLFIKYNDGQGAGDYSFTFSATDKARIREAETGTTYCVCVCGNEVITGISRDECRKIFDLDDDHSSTIKISAPQGKRLRVSGPRGKLGLISRSSFPDRILH